MDSAENSGSMQSSSSRGEEYDSNSHHGSGGGLATAAAAVETPFSSLFHLNHQTKIIGYPRASHVTFSDFFINPPPPPPPPPAPPTYYSLAEDPLANFFDRSSSLLNPDAAVWSKTAMRSSNANCTDSNPNLSQNQAKPLIPSSRTTSTYCNDPICSNDDVALHALQHPQQPLPPSQPTSSPSPTTTTSDHSHLPNHQNKAAGGGRNPKKRTRASRRAPTTVLTTDTTNFRAMVQEFTGVPSPSFFGPAAATSFLFPRTSSLDLFGSSSATPPLHQLPPPYLSRTIARSHTTLPSVSPSAASVTTPAPAATTVAAAAAAATTNTNVTDAMISSSNSGTGAGGNDVINNNHPLNASSANYELPSDLDLVDVRQGTTGLSFPPLLPGGNYSILARRSRPVPAGGALDLPVMSSSSTGDGGISGQSRHCSQLRMGIGFGDEFGLATAGKEAAAEAVGASREENNFINTNSTTGINPHHHQQEVGNGSGGMNMIESWICSSSTSTTG